MDNVRKASLNIPKPPCQGGSSRLPAGCGGAPPLQLKPLERAAGRAHAAQAARQGAFRPVKLPASFQPAALVQTAGSFPGRCGAGPAEGVAENGRVYPGGRSEGETSPRWRRRLGVSHPEMPDPALLPVLDHDADVAPQKGK